MELNITNDSLPVFESLANATRLEILRFIGSEKKSVGEIAEHLNLSNSITTRHIQKMEDANILTSERGLKEHRNKKMVSLKVDTINILFPQKIYKEYNLHTTEVKIGHFTNFSVEPSCGLATIQNVIGKTDEPVFFLDPQRVDASIIWFSDGFIEYKIPNFLKKNEELELLELSFEIASEFPISNNNWPSDISIYINDKKVAVYTVPGNFSDVRGTLTPSWWKDEYSQYGLLKHLRINKKDTGIDGKFFSSVNIHDLNLHDQPYIKLRFQIDEDAINKGGFTIFGKGFGNNDQDIIVNMYYQ
ncbi:ArsR/SmtB family transcription factor [Vagococcus zengguangii]|uniref:ArsR family transcriptional regulator n=1 Tax=Vagococcus zengguangii TaxID=2571750 RepID=A0A4D7CVF0_9ENTE|nr:helix-turn-helix domain-containing protein [Vagococcus zengguangii]QCI87404.1 ArsR family transcriptional regulator [Vagococcus zengguangii]TLG81048.1 ArsR family transcriptional regulator [Vagococcus zengguangii]